MSNPAVAIRERHEGQVRELVLRGSKGNLVTAAMVEELRAAFRDASVVEDRTRRLKLIVVTGEGDHFSYGARVQEHIPGEIERVLPKFHSLVGEMLGCDVPTLARVTGLCLGGGFELALACSMIWCDETAQLGLPEITLGVFPPVASVLLPDRTGDAIALEMILTGRTVPAADAQRAGIINMVTLPGALDAMLEDFVVTSILPRSASSLRIACAAARAHTRRRYADEIAVLEAVYLRQLMSTHDAVEGARAFLEKRKPEWKDA